MDEQTKTLLLAFNEQIELLRKERNDMMIGIGCVLIDLHRHLIEKGTQTEKDVLDRLRMQKSFLDSNVPEKAGSQFVSWLLSNFENGKLDPSLLFRLQQSGEA